MRPYIWLASVAVSFVLADLSANSANAYERYTEARITQVETNDNGIYLFLEVVSGDAPPYGNGGSNEPFNKPYLVLASNATDVTNRKHMLASAFIAQTQGSIMRFRWEDAGSYPGRIIVALLRQ